jgi:hypothetical protein
MTDFCAAFNTVSKPFAPDVVSFNDSQPSDSSLFRKESLLSAVEISSQFSNGASKPASPRDSFAAEPPPLYNAHSPSSKEGSS